MKKLFSLLLIVLLCLPCAFTEADVDALIANGQHDEAIAIVESEIARLQQVLAEIVSVRDAQNAGKVSVEVPITADNWDEYFEVLLFPETDPFGKLINIHWSMFIKEEYAARVDLSREYTIDFAYEYVDTDRFIIFDAENNTVSFSDEPCDCPATDAWDYSEFVTLASSHDLKYQCGHYAGEESPIPLWFLGHLTNREPCSLCPEDAGLHGIDCPLEFTQAQGSIFLFEE